MTQLRETPGNVGRLPACDGPMAGQTKFTLLSVWESSWSRRTRAGGQAERVFEQVEPHGSWMPDLSSRSMPRPIHSRGLIAGRLPRERMT